MSGKLSHAYQYNNNDFRKATRVEKIFIAMVTDDDRFTLTVSEQTYANKLHRAFIICTEHAPYTRQLKLIQETEGVARATAMRIIRDTESIYGQFRKIDKQFQKNFLRDRALKAMDRARALKLYDLELKYLNYLKDIDRLDTDNPTEEIDWSSIQPPDIVYTHDPNHLIEEAHIDEEE